MSTFIEASAAIAATASVGSGTRIWHQAQLADGVVVGENCVIGKGVYLGVGSVVGDRVKIQNGCGVFGAQVGDDVLLAPGVYLLEDPAPRASRPDGFLKGADDWRRVPVTVAQGATIGANCTIAPGVTVGRYAMVAIGSAVHRDVPDHGLVAGNPARQVGWVCACGTRLTDTLTCPGCPATYASGDHGLTAVNQS
ncbi:acyltransferase [Catellatospora chokoriensis]|uniref:N-acetyltransferase n=1 Tax=Catellatospora chokoriensis TaxID=310353 RepID=A0A8J3K7K3_9ACTN|nr:acyltransferase [Catellatospora chokoriensis]GIF94621.1 N-acetyltransferase [Catellatospora chokoriensis]